MSDLERLRELRLTDDDVIAYLERRLDVARSELAANGGRGVELANIVDSYQHALDALKGNLWCLHCEAKL
jgi:hypothetical protein